MLFCVLHQVFNAAGALFIENIQKNSVVRRINPQERREKRIDFF